MSGQTTSHATHTVERSIALPAGRIFEAFSSKEAKAKWFAGPPDKWTELVREMDFRPGGQEKLSGQWTGGPVSHFRGRYLDIVPARRIIYVYGMQMDARAISLSLVTVELVVEGAGTRLIFTEQASFLDGYEDKGGREKGSHALIDALIKSLGA